MEVREKFGKQRALLEAWVPFEKEISVMVVRGKHGESASYEPAKNRHRSHSLEASIAPARIAESVAEGARRIAEKVAVALGYRGIMGLEFFVKIDGPLLVNEMAPRPHNSGHHALDACATSQFEQQLRAVLGLPLGSIRLETPDAVPLLYGKRRAIRMRKMGRATLLAADALGIYLGAIHSCFSFSKSSKSSPHGRFELNSSG